jgi:hypothetical protein
MALLRDLVRCPVCASPDVVYSCEPKCCFNHVCANCKATFQLVTHKAGQRDPTTPIDACDPESGDPAAACAVCHELRLAVLSSDQGKVVLLCAGCRAILELSCEDIAA